MIDLHTHSIFSDGELIPSELVRRALVKGYEAIAITDHVDYSNIECTIEAVKKAKYLEDVLDIKIFAGVELTHIPPSKIAPLVRKARDLGAEIIVVHGETIAEPVYPGTNAAVVETPDVDILSHPGFITEDEAKMAADNDICLEITARSGHNRTNGHVARVGLEAGAKLIVNTDAHSTSDLISKSEAKMIAMGSGLTELQALKILDNSKKFIS
ncbi:histidinol phosphate phosphatase domain-containing protein [Methanosalsum natronophilum]|uniref:histidinol phosphate phosphatase domain-containing protein n=1 Tax=Methanosalsum natronophilum TaxID=768733 RepID=UPI002169C2B1|nr:histidinol phosphate phosphatase domain-containing protein [Methanosalsum natronophilum]MCS3923038.1 histidinol phosphatase-like PHP family hydrolase [Methanosalsum natronophilum]